VSDCDLRHLLEVRRAAAAFDDALTYHVTCEEDLEVKNKGEVRHMTDVAALEILLNRARHAMESLRP
jgi:hypothetical protein